MNFFSSVRFATFTGTTVSIFASVGWADIERTLVLGTMGAAISFFVSYYLKTLIEKKKK